MTDQLTAECVEYYVDFDFNERTTTHPMACEECSDGRLYVSDRVENRAGIIRCDNCTYSERRPMNRTPREWKIVVSG